MVAVRRRETHIRAEQHSEDEWFGADAELLRDQALAASGLLNREIGGRGVFPPQPPGVTSLSYGSMRWKEETGPQRWRRDGQPEGPARILPPPRWLLNDSAALERLALSGAGLAILPTLDGERLAAEGEITVFDQIRLEGASTSQVAAGAGVASFHAETGGDFRWFPLGQATTAADGAFELTTTARSGTELTITFAASRTQARHGYIARIQAEAGVTSAATLRADVYRVRFDLPEDTENAGPLLLQRVDDRQWLPMSHSTAGLRLRLGAQLHIELGPGKYELLDPLSPSRAQAFSVPDADVVVVSSALATAAGDRR